MAEKNVCTCFENPVFGKSGISCLKQGVSVLVSMVKFSDHVMKGVNTPGQSPFPEPLWRPIPRQSSGVLTPFVLCTRSGTGPTSCPTPLTRLRIKNTD